MTSSPTSLLKYIEHVLGTHPHTIHMDISLRQAKTNTTCHRGIPQMVNKFFQRAVSGVKRSNSYKK